MRNKIVASVIAFLNTGVLCSCGSSVEIADKKLITTEKTVGSHSQQEGRNIGTSNDSGTVYSNDSLQYLALERLELVEYVVSSDTLKLVSTSEFLYYPLGKFSTVFSFVKRNPSFLFTKEIEPSDSEVELQRGVVGSSFVKLFLDKEKNALEIVSGRIDSPKVRLINGAEIGMKSQAFYALFLKKPSTIERKGLRVVELISGLDGIRHYYTFKNDVLTQIKFDTDYQFNKQ